ncbi:glycosyl hydrolase 53 family protein [Micromonospora sp. BRA006-A]|nr:glycosyl hydrolase 53 family protein [Micromonospora sp. BRA006-A]
MRGADVSSLQRSLDLGAKYYDAGGVARDPLDILRSVGLNYVRLRVWNNPASGYNNKSRVLAQARAAKAKGLKVLIDFHYPTPGPTPASSTSPPPGPGTASASSATTCTPSPTTSAPPSGQGTLPDSVQIGNEINVGMLWNEGKVVNNDFAPLAGLLKQGYNAVKACGGGIPVMIHTANADSNANARWFYDGIRAQGVQWDMTALSYYCMWHGSLANLYNNIVDVRNRYGKPVVIVETAYPFTRADADGEPNAIGDATCDGISATWAGQAQEFDWVQNTARNAGAIGVFYWEPTWYAVSGNGWDPANINGTGNQWDNMAVFDWFGRVNPGCAGRPDGPTGAPLISARGASGSSGGGPTR